MGCAGADPACCSHLYMCRASSPQLVTASLRWPGLCSAEDGGPSSSKAPAGSGSRTAGAGSGVDEDNHPTQRELDNLREFVLTQQWLRQQTLGDASGGAAAAAGGGAAAAGAAQQLQAMQQLWEQGGRGG